MTSLQQNNEDVSVENVLPLTAGPVGDFPSAGQQGGTPPSSTPESPDNLSAVIDALAGVLRGGVDIHRCEAARALGKISHDQATDMATDVLLEALLDEDEDVRTDAAEALEVTGDSRAAKQLLENLIGDPCSEVKMAALKALTKMKSTEVIPWLKKLLSWHSKDIAWDEDEFYEGGWDSWVDLQIAAIKALADFDVADAIPEIVAAINEEDAQDLTEFAFAAFARMGGPGARVLVEFLADKDSRRRRRAAVVLAGIDHDAARAAVLHALKDPAKDVRLAVAEAISAENFSDQICELLLADPEADIRAVAIAKVKDEDIEQLISWLDDPAGGVQLAVLKRLMAIKDRTPNPALNEKLESLALAAEPAIAGAALETLAVWFGEASYNILQSALLETENPEELRLGALRGLKDIASDKAVAVLTQTLSMDDRQIRLDAIAALGEIALVSPFPNLASTTLVAALNAEITPLPEEAEEVEEPPQEEAETEVKAESEEQVEEADDELSELAEEKSEEDYPTSTWQSIMGNDGPTEGRMAELGDSKKNRIHLTETDMEMLALSAQTPRKGRVKLADVIPAYKDVPQFSARVLSALAEPEIASALAQNIEGDNKEICNSALDSLVQIGKELGTLPQDAIDALMRVVANSERDSRLLAIRALGVAQAKSCAGFLVHRLDDGDSYVKTEVINAMSCMGVELAQLEELVSDPERSVRLAAARALVDEKGEEALERITQFAFDYEGYLRYEAGQMLRKIGSAKANPGIISVLEDKDRRREWGVAIEVLAVINSNK